MKTDSLKEIIKKTALSLFKEKGLGNVSTRDLNNRLNISRSHMYHYYNNWEELKLDAIKFMLDEDINEFLKCHENKDEKESSEHLFDFLNYHLPDAPSSHWILYLEIWPISARDQRYADLIHANFIQWLEVLEKIISCGIAKGEFLANDSSVLARRIWALIDGYSSMLIVEYSDEKRSEFIKEIFDFSLNALRGHKG